MSDGPFFFAWVDAGETTFGSEHLVEDELIYNAKVSHVEAGVPTLTIEIRNPRKGLTGAGVKRHAWFSWWNGAENKPLFFGSVVALPTNLIAETVQLILTAKPSDFVAQKRVLAAAMRVLPNYDEVFVADAYLDDPDTVLNGYTKLWHVDRLTGAVSTSDVLVGEDGVEIFQQSEAYYDSVKFTLGQTPPDVIPVTATVTWNQTYSGDVDFGSKVFASYTGDGILNDWPKTGATLQGGWSVKSASAVDVYNVAGAQTVSWSYSWQNNAATHNDGDTLTTNYSSSTPVLTGPFLSVGLTNNTTTVIGEVSAGRAASSSGNFTTLYVPEYVIDTTLVLTYNAKRSRSETVNLSVAANLQPIVYEPDGSTPVTTEPVQLTGRDVGVALSDSTVPIGSPSLSGYFATSRGLDSLRYLILVGVAHATEKSRAARTDFDCSWERSIELSCRKNALLYDDRIPGGSSLGKITEYSFEVDGDSGAQFGTVTMLSAIGYGGAIADVAGDSVVYEDDVYEPDGFERTGQIIALPEGNVGFAPPVDTIIDDGVRFPLSRATAVVSETITGSVDAQAAAITASFESEKQLAILQATRSTSLSQSILIQSELAAANQNSTSAALKANPLHYDLELLDVASGKFDREYDVALTDLELPKQVDLGSAEIVLMAPSWMRDVDSVGASGVT